MLEVDEDSRLGSEMLRGGSRYGAGDTPDDDQTAAFYEMAVERLAAMGIARYEISNFARPGFESRHNLKYWTRQPYLGFGVDAHSMLISSSRPQEAVRFAAPDSLEAYVGGAPPQKTLVSAWAAAEEAFFLGLRLNQGLDLRRTRAEFGEPAIANFSEAISECVGSGLLEREGDVIRLTPRGRLLSNEVFERFILDPTPILCAEDTPVLRV